MLLLRARSAMYVLSVMHAKSKTEPPTPPSDQRIYIFKRDILSGETLAEKIPSWIERLLLPRLSEISGDVKALNGRIDGLAGRINGLEKGIESLRNEMLSRFDAVHTRLDSIEKRIPMIEDLAEIKVRLTEVEKKVALLRA
ncbi:MAG: hypothetical protein AOA66_0701 [Candidatus Bathyarchaeota archaeon BA2]|nr:MAG: hypothetical protein AOA66_0701 [Candidatus Bathyarchaeota archaeon BA2]